MAENERINIPLMLAKLNELFDKEEQLCRQMEELQKLYLQLQEDKELLQNMIMYASNKNSRR